MQEYAFISLYMLTTISHYLTEIICLQLFSHVLCAKPNKLRQSQPILVYPNAKSIQAHGCQPQKK